MFPILVLAMMIAVQPVIAQNGIDKSPTCTTCKVDNLIADVYNLTPEDVPGQLISGQFAYVMHLNGKKDAPIDMTLEEIAEFVNSAGFNYLKENGDVYFTVLLENKYFLVEVERLGDSYGPLKIQSNDKTIREHLSPFLQVIIPRLKKEDV